MTVRQLLKILMDLPTGMDLSKTKIDIVSDYDQRYMSLDKVEIHQNDNRILLFMEGIE